MRRILALALLTIFFSAASIHAQWTFVDSLKLGGIYDIAGLVADSNGHLLGATSSNLRVYDLATQTWSTRSYPATGRPLLAVMPSGRLVASFPGTGIFYSDDVGASWNVLGRGFSPASASSIVWQDTALLVVGGPGSGMQVLHKSDSNWQQVPHSLSILPVAGFATHSGYFAVGSGAFLFRSKDPLDWTRSDSATLDPKIRRTLVTEEGTILALAQFSSSLFRSTDWGKTWSTPLSLSGLSGLQSMMLLKNGWVIVTAGSQGFYISQDDGASWRQVRQLSLQTPLAMALTGRNDVFATSSSGVFRSRDAGRSWDAIDSGFSVTSAQSIGSLRDTVFVSLTQRGEYRASGVPFHWAESNDSLASGVVDYQVYSGKLYARSAERIVYWNGSSWSALPNLFEDQLPITYAISKSGRVFAASSTQFYYLPDGGASEWRTVSQLFGFLVKQVAVDSAGRVYALVGKDSLLYSTDDGDNWSDLPNGPTNTNVTSLFATKDTLVVATLTSTDAGLYRTADLGAHWLTMPYTLVNLRGAAAYQGRYFAYSGTSLLEREAQEAAWTATSQIPSTESIIGLTINSTGRAYLVTGRGLYTRQLPSVQVGVHYRVPAGTFSVFPNPARRMTTIEGAVSVEILDVTGRTVDTIRATELDCSKYPAGVYQLRNESGEIVKLLIVR